MKVKSSKRKKKLLYRIVIQSSFFNVDDTGSEAKAKRLMKIAKKHQKLLTKPFGKKPKESKYRGWYESESKNLIAWRKLVSPFAIKSTLTLIN